MAGALSELVSFLDDYLAVEEVPDDPRALNGLQVENSGSLSRILAAVDACQASVDAAAEVPGTLLLVHHGLFWGGPAPLVGREARRVRALFESDVALYSAHLPLDCHEEVGNNAVLARHLGLASAAPWGDYKGASIGTAGELDDSLASLVDRIADTLKVEPQVIAGGPERVSRVAVVTGAGAGLLSQARDDGIDTLITGEAPHHAFFDAEEWGINLILAGHYATETVGVKELAALLSERFGLDWSFFDHPTGL